MICQYPIIPNSCLTEFFRGNHPKITPRLELGSKCAEKPGLQCARKGSPTQTTQKRGQRVRNTQEIQSKPHLSTLCLQHSLRQMSLLRNHIGLVLAGLGLADHFVQRRSQLRQQTAFVIVPNSDLGGSVITPSLSSKLPESPRWQFQCRCRPTEHRNNSPPLHKLQIRKLHWHYSHQFLESVSSKYSLRLQGLALGSIGSWREDLNYRNKLSWSLSQTAV